MQKVVALSCSVSGVASLGPLIDVGAESALFNVNLHLVVNSGGDHNPTATAHGLKHLLVFFLFADDPNFVAQVFAFVPLPHFHHVILSQLAHLLTKHNLVASLFLECPDGLFRSIEFLHNLVIPVSSGKLFLLELACDAFILVAFRSQLFFPN